MHNIILVFCVIVLLTGCASKEDKALIKAYEINKPYHQQLQKTEKTQLYEGNNTKALLTATYLYEENIDKEYKPDEVFIVGIYIEEMQEESFDLEGYSLALNGTAPKSIQKLAANDPLLKHISFVSEWSTFYLITFPHTTSKSFKLIFKSDRYGKGELPFAKVAKYVLTKEAL